MTLLAAAGAFADGMWVCHGPYGGSSSVLLRSQGADGGIFAAVLCNGVYYLPAGGSTWQNRSGGLENPYVKALVQNPQNPDILYAGTRQGVYWTTDGGWQWEPRTTGIGSGHVEALAIDPLNPQILYAEKWGDVYKTVNGGLNWTLSNTGLPGGLDCCALLVDPVDPQIVYAGLTYAYGGTNGEGVYKSVDAGGTWQLSSEGMLNGRVLALTFDPRSSQTIYAGVYGSGYYSYGGVYVSHDAGATWTWRGEDLPQDIWPLSLAVAYDGDTDEPILHLAASYVYQNLPQPPGGWQPRYFQSRDDGETWEQCTNGVTYPNLLAVLVDPDRPEEVWLGCDRGGIFRSTDGGNTFTHWSTGLARMGIKGLGVHPLNDDVVYAGVVAPMGQYSDEEGGVYVTFDGGKTWTPRCQDMSLTAGYYTSAVAVAPNDPEVVYAPNCGWMLYVSTNEGKNWEWRGFPHGIDGYWLTDVVVDPHDPKVAYVSGAGFEPSWPDIYKTVDAGETWRPVASNVVYAIFTCLAISNANPDVVYAGTGWEGILKTTNGGETWQSTGFDNEEAMIGDIVIDPSRPSHVYACDDQWGGSGVYVSYDAGDSWATYNEGLTDLDVNALAVDAPLPSRDGPTTLYAGTRHAGVFRRAEGGLWAPINNGLKSECIQALAAGPEPTDSEPRNRARVLYAGTDRGVYRWIVPGDLNCDGEIDNFDIGPFVLALTRPEEYAEVYPDCGVPLADLNEDGAVNNFDIGPFVALLTE
jgi:photosystem II stability/assembly factor-like uncharacterized protein